MPISLLTLICFSTFFPCVPSDGSGSQIPDNAQNGDTRTGLHASAHWSVTGTGKAPNRVPTFCVLPTYTPHGHLGALEISFFVFPNFISALIYTANDGQLNLLFPSLIVTNMHAHNSHTHTMSWKNLPMHFARVSFINRAQLPMEWAHPRIDHSIYQSPVVHPSFSQLHNTGYNEPAFHSPWGWLVYPRRLSFGL